MYEGVSSINSSEQQRNLLNAAMTIQILQKAGGLSEELSASHFYGLC